MPPRMEINLWSTTLALQLARARRQRAPPCHFAPLSLSPLIYLRWLYWKSELYTHFLSICCGSIHKVFSFNVGFGSFMHYIQTYAYHTSVHCIWIRSTSCLHGRVARIVSSNLFRTLRYASNMMSASTSKLLANRNRVIRNQSGTRSIFESASASIISGTSV